MLRRTLLGAALMAALFVAWLLAVWPPPLWYATHFPARTAFMAHHGIDSVAQRYDPLPLDSIAPSMVTAVLRGEDNRFYSHHGVDWVELRRAMGYPRDDFSLRSRRDLRDLYHALRTVPGKRQEVRGASTITQQLAKNLYLSPSRNPLRKLKETVTAYRLELALDKRRIMELYLNVVELGPDVWGVPAASDVYFGKDPLHLTRGEAAALAATLPSPRTANPGFRPERLRWRRAMILGRM